MTTNTSTDVQIRWICRWYVLMFWGRIRRKYRHDYRIVLKSDDMRAPRNEKPSSVK